MCAVKYVPMKYPIFDKPAGSKLGRIRYFASVPDMIAIHKLKTLQHNNFRQKCNLR